MIGIDVVLHCESNIMLQSRHFPQILLIADMIPGQQTEDLAVNNIVSLWYIDNGSGVKTLFVDYDSIHCIYYLIIGSILVILQASHNRSGRNLVQSASVLFWRN